MRAMRSDRAVVVGAGMGGLVAALDLAARGLDVTVVEKEATLGGKMRESVVAGVAIDAGPTVFTMRSVFEEIFADSGASLTDHVRLKPVEILARHAWDQGAVNGEQRLDLFADIGRSADAIGDFAGAAEARRYRQFCDRARNIYQTLEEPFIRAQRPGPIGLVRHAGLGGLGDLWRISPFETLWDALGTHFHDPRLRQLFGRYATYCGSSPFQAPATLMLVAHVEREGVWLIEGGMHRIAAALAGLAAKRGAAFRYGAEVAEVLVAGGRASGVRLTSGERIAADSVIVNADASAVSGGFLGLAAARAVPASNAARSLSAVTWALVAEAKGFPLLRHTVFFSNDYRAEFDDIFQQSRLPRGPSVYVCAQDRDGGAATVPTGPERIFCLVNAPATGDRNNFPHKEIEQCEERMIRLLERCGLSLLPHPDSGTVTTPADFNRLFPGTGGALYGRATHGWNASFRRPSSRTRMPGLYLAGGSVHPGPGVPMAALSGRLAASSLLSDLTSKGRASTIPSRKAATAGGMSMR